MEDDLKNKLLLRARSWAGSITKKATRNLGRYAGLISIESRVDERNGRIGVVSTATSVNPLKPVARAYEFGSGTRSRSKKTSKWQQGAGGKILITPKRKRVLAFHWEKVNASTPAGTKFRGISTTTGKALFNFVEHPGVRAANGGRGYLAPAISEVRKKMSADIHKDVDSSVKLVFKRAFAPK